MLRWIKSWSTLPLVAILTLLADQASKAIVVNNLALSESWTPIPQLEWLFSITFVSNTGAAFGLLPNLGDFFVIVAILVIAAIVIYYHHLPAGYPLVRIALGLQLGGALGNLFDRLVVGYVIDFIHFKFWPVFNVADSAIVVGISFLAWTMLRESRSIDQDEAEKASRL